MSYYGMNWHPASNPPMNHEAVLEHCRRANAKWQLVQDEAKFASQMIERCPNTNVILREKWDAPHRDVWREEEGKAPVLIYKARSAKQWLDDHLKNPVVLHPRMWLQAGNEAGFGDEWLVWTEELIRENERRGWPVRLVILNCSVGTPEPHDWPRARRVLQLADQHRTRVVVGLHEYYDTLPVVGISGVAIEAPDVHDMAKWPTRAQLLDGRPLWHCGRFRFMLAYCDQQGIGQPRIVINEHGSDAIRDVQPITNTWGQKAPDEQHGFNNIEPALERWYPNVDPQLTFVLHMEWLRRNVYAGSPVEDEGVIVFCAGDSSLDKRMWKHFDMQKRYMYLEKIEVLNEQIASGTPPVVPPAPPDVPPPVVIDPPSDPPEEVEDETPPPAPPPGNVDDQILAAFMTLLNQITAKLKTIDKKLDRVLAEEYHAEVVDATLIIRRGQDAITTPE